MKIADQGDIDAHFVQLVANVRHSLGGFWGVDRDPDHFGARDGQFLDLNGGANDVNGVGIGHGLNAHGCAPTHGDNTRAPNHFGLSAFALCRQGYANGQGKI